MPYYQRQHLRRLERINLSSHCPIYFVTICSFQRRPILTTSSMIREIEPCFKNSLKHSGWAIGKYVIMPDHIHFFCQDRENRKSLSDFVRDIKKWLSKRAHVNGFEGDIWQKEFFDRVLRSSESHKEKWEYVRLNPLRAGLCAESEEWPFQGECEIL